MSRASTNNAAGIDTVDFIALAAPHRWREIAGFYGSSWWEEKDAAARRRERFQPAPEIYGFDGWFAEFKKDYPHFGSGADWYSAPQPSGLNPALYFVGELTSEYAPRCCGDRRGTISIQTGNDDETPVRIHCACRRSARTMSAWFGLPTKVP